MFELKQINNLFTSVLAFLKSKSDLIIFIFKNIFISYFLFCVFLTLAGQLYGHSLGLSSSWVGTMGAGYGELIGTIRGVWLPLLQSPGSLWYHLKLFTHYFIAVAPAASILMIFFGFLFAVQIGYFTWGLHSTDMKERLFRDFAKNYKFWILGLLVLTIFICSYVLLYDARNTPIFNPSCPPGGSCTTNGALPVNPGAKSLNSVLESIYLHVPHLFTQSFVLGICVIVVFLLICMTIVTIYRSILRFDKNKCNFGVVCLSTFLSYVCLSTGLVVYIIFEQPVIETLRYLLNNFGLATERQGFIGLSLDIWAIMLFVTGFVAYMMWATLYSPDKNDTTYLCPDFASGKGKGSYTNLDYWIMCLGCTVWKNQYKIVLCIGALPLFFNLLESLKSILIYNAMVFEGQHPFHQYSEYSSNSTSMANPSENNGWFKGLKNWWYGDASPKTPLTPLESQQQSLDVVQKYVKEQTAQCAKYSDKMTLSSPRTANVLGVQQRECFNSLIRLQECSSQLAQIAARTSYDTTPNTFVDAAGKAFGDRLGQVAGPMLEEVASNGIKVTAENANSQ